MSWTRGRTIGHGSTATVSLAVSHGSGEIFAVKSTEYSKSDALRREREMLSGIDFPQIIAYRGWDTTVEGGRMVCNLCMEYAPWGSLADAIRENGGRLDEQMIRSCTRAILLGLEHLHSKGIVHCDIKGRNILLMDGGLKITDLGCARHVDDPASVERTVVGTPLFMAPEVARGAPPGPAGDLWSLGCTVIEMATGQPPWADVTDSPVSALYRIGFSGECPNIPNSLSELGKDFLGRCLKLDPSERWSATELLGHDFIGRSLDCTIEDFKLLTRSASPTCVLDQGVWSLIETEFNLLGESLSLQGISRSSDSRIRQLITAHDGEVDMDFHDDDNWIIVRGRVMIEGDGCAGINDDTSREMAPEAGNHQRPVPDLTSTSGSSDMLNSIDSLAIDNGDEIEGKGPLTFSPSENYDKDMFIHCHIHLACLAFQFSEANSTLLSFHEQDIDEDTQSQSQHRFPVDKSKLKP